MKTIHTLRGHPRPTRMSHIVKKCSAKTMIHPVWVIQVPKTSLYVYSFEYVCEGGAGAGWVCE